MIYSISINLTLRNYSINTIYTHMLTNEHAYQSHANQSYYHNYANITVSHNYGIEYNNNNNKVIDDHNNDCYLLNYEMMHSFADDL